ncbi:MAG TPA: hypothetical protein PLP17_12235 [Oligoflexia bacterium]|nr:hypothetical protein [Oligoflexia bacterium]
MGEEKDETKSSAEAPAEQSAPTAPEQAPPDSGLHKLKPPKPMLAGVTQAAREIRQSWRCAGCGELMEEQFDACWKCGKCREEEGPGGTDHAAEIAQKTACSVCSSCGAEVENGFIATNLGYVFQWIPGIPEEGLQGDETENINITARRCSRCGLLALYAAG